MENFKQLNGLVGLDEAEMKLIKGGEGIGYSLGQTFRKAYCAVRDWAISYEGDPFIRRKMGGL